MALKRVHHTDNAETFGPVRFGPQDLRDIADVFRDLDSRARLLPGSRTKYRVLHHESDDVEDVLGYPDADTLPSLAVLSGDLLLYLFAARDGTVIDKPATPRDSTDATAVEDAAERLRRIVRPRQLPPFEALRQRRLSTGAALGLLGLGGLFFAGAELLVTSKHTTGGAVAMGLEWLCVVLVFLFSRRPRDLIRLRGKDEPWWERRQGLLALVGVVVTVLVPFVIYALQSQQG